MKAELMPRPVHTSRVISKAQGYIHLIPLYCMVCCNVLAVLEVDGDASCAIEMAADARGFHESLTCEKEFSAGKVVDLGLLTKRSRCLQASSASQA